MSRPSPFLGLAFLAMSVLPSPVRSQEVAPEDTTGEIQDTTVRFEAPAPDPVPKALADADRPVDTRRQDSLRTLELEKKYKRGRFLAWTGLALTAAEPFLLSYYPEQTLGFSYLMPIPPLMYLLGVPMAGTATLDMGRLAGKYPGYADPGRTGMGAYYSGVWLKFGAEGWLAYVLLSNFEVGFLGPIPLPYFDVEGKDFIGPLAMLGGGIACDLYAMNRFKIRRAAALKALPGGLSLMPTLSWEKGGEARPGAMLAYRF